MLNDKICHLKQQILFINLIYNIYLTLKKGIKQNKMEIS